MDRDATAEPHPPNLPSAPARGEAHVWRVELPATDGRAAARRALRQILGAYLGEAPGDVALTVGKQGKPALAVERRSGSAAGEDRGKPAAARPPITFNLSHSGSLGLVAVAAGGTAVGVDVERLRPRRDLARLAKRWLPADDAEAVAAAGEEGREEVFYAAWTRYEARAKCTGLGLSGPSPGPEIVALELAIDPGYAAALAFDAGAAPAGSTPAGGAVAAAEGAPIYVRRFELPA